MAERVLESDGRAALSLSPQVEVDLHSIRALANRTAFEGVELGSDDINLLQRDLLPGWDEDWLVIDRERLRQERLHLLESYGRELSRRGRHGEAIAVALAAVAIEPLRESAQAAVIEAHLGEGNVSEALRQYHRYRELIEVEIGVGPGEQLRALMGPYLPGSTLSFR